MGLPFGTSSYPDLVAQAGKDGRVFLLSRDSLGGREQGAGGTDDAVAVSGPYQGQWGHPAAFGPVASVASSTTASGDYLYYVRSNDQMRYLELGATSAGTPTLTDVASSSVKLGYSSGSPVGGYIVTAWLDGAQVLQQAAPGLTATSLLTFTGATGAKTDVHLIRDVAITAGG